MSRPGSTEKTYLWHGSDVPRARFGGEGEPDVLHLGTLSQAAMRCGDKYLHLVEIDRGLTRRIRDKGSDNRASIQRARKKGVDSLTYLNRYEGIDGARLDRVLKEHPGKDLDAISDREFRRLFPGTEDSLLLLDPGAARVLGCYAGRDNAHRGRMEQIVRGGAAMRRRSPAATLDFHSWLGKRHPTVIPESKFGSFERDAMSDCRRALVRALEELDPAAPPVFGLESRHLMTERGVRYLTAPNVLLALSEGQGDFLGGIANGVVYVEEAARGQGIATNLHICAEQSRCVALKPSHFSEGGYAARKAAHRRLCEMAKDRGDPVCEENLDAYDLRSRTVSPEP